MGSFDLWLARRTVGEVLFDSEVANLIRRHYPQAMRLTYGSFSSFFSPFRRSIRDTDCSKRDRIPFLIVFPEKAIPIERQLDRIRFDDQRCVARLRLTSLVPNLGEELSSLPYLIFDVECGGLTEGMAAEESASVFESESRSALTVEEGVALLTHAPNALRRHNIGCAGHLLDECFVPVFGRCPLSGPILTVFGKKSAKPDLGFASCGRRLRFGEALKF